MWVIGPNRFGEEIHKYNKWVNTRWLENNWNEWILLIASKLWPPTTFQALTKSLLYIRLVHLPRDSCEVGIIIIHFIDERIHQERLRNLTSVTQLVVVRAEIWIQFHLTLRACALPPSSPHGLPTHARIMAVQPWLSNPLVACKELYCKTSKLQLVFQSI